MDAVSLLLSEIAININIIEPFYFPFIGLIQYFSDISSKRRDHQNICSRELLVMYRIKYLQFRTLEKEKLYFI
jgi:hypothetical protein